MRSKPKKQPVAKSPALTHRNIAQMRRTMAAARAVCISLQSILSDESEELQHALEGIDNAESVLAHEDGKLYEAEALKLIAA
jgi:hypothetical protein